MIISLFIAPADMCGDSVEDVLLKRIHVAHMLERTVVVHSELIV